MSGGRVRGLAAAATAAALLALGCAGLAPGPGDAPPDPALPARARVEGVPFFPQREDQCGPAALAMVLAWGGLAADPETLRPWVYTESLRGSLQPALTAAARRAGRIAVPLAGREALEREIASGHPVIVLQNLGLEWVPLWHYAVVIGYDRERDELFLHSGTEADRRVSGELFRRSWRRAGDWGLVVLPPGRLPATAGEAALLEALAALERAGRPEAALSGYRALLARFPQSLPALLGLGNSAFAAGDLPLAEGALLQAVRLHPEAAVAFNNLAHVRIACGRPGAALPAARRAVALGGPHRAVFLGTLAEALAALPQAPETAGEDSEKIVDEPQCN